MKNTTTFILVLCVLFPLSLFSQESDGETRARQIYQDALNQSIDQEWDGAIYDFQKLIDLFPDNELRDDAMFWVAYCTEKKGGHSHDAFELYENLHKTYPESEWIDDAILKQISIAEHFGQQGARKYINFLVDQMESDHAVIRQQSAISLGKIGDKRALPILEDIRDSEEYGAEAKKLLSKLRSSEPKIAESREPNTPKTSPTPNTRGKGINLGNYNPEDVPDVGKTNFLNREHKLYKSLLRTDDSWTQQQLLDYGMFILLPPSEFENYYTSGDEEARRRWIIEDFKEHDPTPGTPQNEVLQEFERRVQYAHAHFNELWEYSKMRYLTDEFQKEGWANAPWDARGDVYVKYGEPDYTTIADYNPLYYEEWTYYRYNVDFVINKYRTNIYGNAIFPGPMVRYRMRSYFDLSQFEWEYVYNKEFYYP